jgi:hypothetical protein
VNGVTAITTAARRPERAAARAIDRTPRTDGDSPDTEATTGPQKKGNVSRAEFSALLALISGAGSRVRSDLMQQLPPEGASLVDKLLDDVAAEQTTEGTTGETGSSEGARAGAEGLLMPIPSPLMAPADDREAQRAAQAVSEALRYGILTTSMDQQPTASSSNDVLRDRLGGKARVGTPQIGTTSGGWSDMVGERTALAVLSRITTKPESSVEQLMAIGDRRGADARVALDALLSKAGTPAGVEIADSAAASAAATAAASASASALAAATAASAANPTTPIKDVDALAPELRSRVQRVIDRMQHEYGHEVTIVETARSQERQDHLYDQGRSRPGAIVTWTRDSAHTRGAAVDVIVDGSWENGLGFARLQEIAKEEGLRTLGMKDPGHLELSDRADRASASAVPLAFDKVTAAYQRQGPSAMPAGVASVATVAEVAPVARVAGTAPTPMGDGAAAYVAQANASRTTSSESNGGASDRGARDDGGQPLTSGRKPGSGKPEVSDDASGFGGAYGSAQHRTPTTDVGHGASVAPAAGREQAQRVSDVQAMRADAPATPLSRMTLNVENANGTQDRITVDLRGNAVDTFISTDASSAERMKLRTGELQESLGRHGLDAESVRISGAAKQEAPDTSRALGSERDALRANGAAPTTSGEGAQSQSQRDRATGRDWEKQQDARREQKEQAAREQQRDQASQRGWQNLFNETK